jgi:hypothetical protein
MTDTYRIKHWDEHFEIAQTRRSATMKFKFFACPNRHDGKSFRRLSRHPRGPEVFAAWILIVQVASKQPRRGTLKDLDGPLTAMDLCDCTGFPEEIFVLAFEVLTDEAIGWLEVV